MSKTHFHTTDPLGDRLVRQIVTAAACHLLQDCFIFNFVSGCEVQIEIVFSIAKQTIKRASAYT